jgi:glycosyltransferase involved in cell wall biosynthesis
VPKKLNLTNKKIVLLIVETTIPPVSRANLRLYHLGLNLMREKQFHVHMITPSMMPWTRRTVILDKIIMNQYWGFNKYLYANIRTLVRSWHFIATILSVIYLSWYFQKVHKKKISIIHAWNPLAGFAAIISGKILRTPVFIDFTDFYSDIAVSDMPIFANTLKKIEKYVLQNAKKVFVVSNKMREFLANTLHIQKEKIVIVPDGVDLHNFDYHTKGANVRSELGLKKKTFTLIFHGDIKYDDGVDILFDALRIVVKKYPDMKLIILGGGGAYFNSLKKQLDTKPLKDIVSYLGWVDHKLVSAYIGASDVGVMPMRGSLNHNLYLSFKLFEYWAMKKPVIVTKLDAITEIVVNKKSGLIITENNPKQLALAIEYMITHRSEASRMGAYGRSVVEAKFNWEKLMQREVNEYKNSLET